MILYRVILQLAVQNLTKWFFPELTGKLTNVLVQHFWQQFVKSSLSIIMIVVYVTGPEKTGLIYT